MYDGCCTKNLTYTDVWFTAVLRTCRPSTIPSITKGELEVFEVVDSRKISMNFRDPEIKLKFCVYARLCTPRHPQAVFIHHTPANRHVCFCIYFDWRCPLEISTAMQVTDYRSRKGSERCYTTLSRLGA